MAYAIHRHPHRHIVTREHRHPKADGGWWKFGLTAAIMTAVAIVILSSPVLRQTDSSAAAAPSIKFMTPSITRLSPSEINAEPVLGVVDLTTTAPVDTQSQVSVAPVASSKDAASTSANVTTAAQAPVATNIHSVNFSTLSSLRTLSVQMGGGTVDASTIKYADLTGDGSDEAIVPISSDGTAGNVGYVVYTERGGNPVAILTRQASKSARSLVPSFDNGQLSESSAVYGPTDANCCPSQIVRTYFKWDGTSLVQDRSTTLNIPQGKQAD